LRFEQQEPGPQPDGVGHEAELPVQYDAPRQSAGSAAMHCVFADT
jgi:hypothetical protein